MAEYKTSEAQRRAVKNYEQKRTRGEANQGRAKTFVRKYATVDDMKELIDIFNENHAEQIEIR